MLADPIANGGRPALEAMGTELAPEFGAVVTSFSPARFQIVAMWIEDGGIVTRLAFRKLLSANEPTHRSAVQTTLARDFAPGNTALEQRRHRLIALHAAFPVLCDQAPMPRGRLGGQWFRLGFRCRLRFLCHRARHFGQQPMMRRQRLDQGIAHVVQQMPAIRYLYSSWCGLGGGRGVQTGAIPADNLGPRVRKQPLFCALRASVR